MKKILFQVILLLLIPLASPGQVTLFPEVNKQDIPDIYIRKVEITDQFTILHFYYYPMDETSICADRSFHLVPKGTGQMLYIIRAKGIPICPKRIKVGGMNISHEFTLWFPKLEKKVYRFDVIESPRDGFNFYNVSINNGQQNPLPDTCIFRTRKEFEKHFETNAENLNRIEGIWQIHEVMDHYGFDHIIDRKYKDSYYEVAIIKEDSRFLVYELDGTPLEAEYINVAGGRGHYFTKYFREIHTEINTYVQDMTEGRFNLEYELPGRLAHEELLERYRPGDRILMFLEIDRLVPEVSEKPETRKKK